MKILKDDVKYDGKNHYDMVHSWITHDFNITANGFRLYVILCNALTTSRIDKKNFCPTTKILASMFRVSIPTIKRMLTELKNFGYISIIDEKTNDHNNSTIIIHPRPNKEKYQNQLKKINEKKEIKSDTT